MKKPADTDENFFADIESLKRIAGTPEKPESLAAYKKWIKEALLINREMTRNMSEGLVIIKTTDSSIIYASPKFEAMFGYGPDELRGKKISVINAPSDKSPEDVLVEIRAELLDKGTWRGEILNRRKDGTTFWSSANVSTFDHSVYGTVWICAQIDISERKQAQETLWESEKNLKYVVENSMDASYRRNMRLNRYDFMSPTIEKIIGYTRDELMAMSIDELFANIHPDDHSRIAETLEKAMANEPAPYRVDYRCRTKNGDYRWLSDLFTIIRDDAGLPLYRVGSVRDVTEQKKTEQDLQLFRAIIETSHEAIAACDPSGRLIYINPAHERLFGRSREEAMAYNYRDYHSPESIELLNRVVVPALQRNESWEGEMLVHKADGTHFPLWKRADFVRDEHGRMVFGFAIMHDVTEHRQEEEALRDSEEKFKSLFDNSMDGIILATPEGSIFTANRAACDMLGYSEEEMTGIKREDVVDMKDPHWPLAIEERMRTGHFKTELVFRRKNGEPFTVDVSSSLFSLGNGEQRACISFRDITERKRMEQDLDKYRKRLEEMVKERTSELEVKNINLQELNTALRVLLRQREDDRKELEERFVQNIQNLVLPYIEQVQKGVLDVSQQAGLKVIESNLAEITTPLLKNLSQFNLTPREMKVAALIKRGKSSKEIADLLNIAVGSVNVHRKKIRKKLDLTNRNANLLSYLEGLD